MKRATGGGGYVGGGGGVSIHARWGARDYLQYLNGAGDLFQFTRAGERATGASRGVIRTGQMNLTTANTVALGVKSNTGWAITNTTSPATNEGVVKQTVTGTKYISTEGGSD